MRSKRTCQPNPIQVCVKHQNQEGFTIIEVLMAISIFAVGMLAVATMQYSAIRVNYTANRITTRTTWAQDRMEQLAALPYTDANLVDGNATVGVVTTYTDPSPPTGFTVTWTVDDDNPVQNTKLITVTVTEGSSTVRLTTVKANI